MQSFEATLGVRDDLEAGVGVLPDGEELLVLFDGAVVGVGALVGDSGPVVHGGGEDGLHGAAVVVSFEEPVERIDGLGESLALEVRQGEGAPDRCPWIGLDGLLEMSGGIVEAPFANEIHPRAYW
jgi:hypothetical protein